MNREEGRVEEGGGIVTIPANLQDLYGCLSGGKELLNDVWAGTQCAAPLVWLQECLNFRNGGIQQIELVYRSCAATPPAALSHYS